MARPGAMRRTRRPPPRNARAMARSGGTAERGGPFRSQHRNHPPADASSAVVIRLVAAAAVAAMAFAPGTTMAAATPSPSPSLGTLLAAPPESDFVDDAQAFTRVQGDFDVTEYVDLLAPSDPADLQTTLKQDGFLSGFGRSWAQKGTGHLLLEMVVAFKGGTGAKNWLTSSQAADSSNQYFKRAIVVTGVEPSYGGHFADPAAPAYADIIAFVKGNDYFLIGILSGSDDLADSASTQTRKQYEFAPSSTIPPAQWPENASSSNAQNDIAYRLGGLMADVLVLPLLAGIVLLVVGLIRRSKRRPMMAMYAAPPGGVQLSPDGNYWWDGQAWRDASREAPPAALRSVDGYYCWDGRTWRAGPPPAST